MSREGTLIKNTAIITIGKICTQLITFFLLPLYTAILSTEEYGMIDLFNNLVFLLVPIITLQLEQGIFRDLLEARNDTKKQKSIITSGFVLIAIQMIIYLVIYQLLAPHIGNDYKQYLVLNVIVYSGSSVLLQVARGLGYNKIYAMASFISATGTIMGNILFLLVFHLRAEGMLLGTAVGQIVTIIYLSIRLRLYKYISIHAIDKKRGGRLLKYSIPLIPNSISWWIFNASDRVIVSTVLGVAKNGILSAASKFSTVYITFYNIFNISWVESISLHIKDSDIEEFFNKIFQVALRFFVAIGLGIIACMPIVYPILINKKFSSGYFLVPILITASLFNVIVGLISVIYVAKKNTKAIANTSFVASILNIVIHITLIHFIDLYAAAVSTLASFFIMSIYRLYDINKRYFKIRIEKKFVVFTMISFVVILLCYYTQNIIFSLFSILWAGIYAFVVNRKCFNSILQFILNKIKKNR